MMTPKKSTDRLIYIMGAVNDLVGGLNGQPFTWGDSERQAKEHILACLGFAIVSKSKLERGGHELKRGAKPVGKAYFGAPLKRYADVYVLGLQTKRTLKWHDLYSKGKALLEGTGQIRRIEYVREPSPLLDRVKSVVAQLEKDVELDLVYEYTLGKAEALRMIREGVKEE